LQFQSAPGFHCQLLKGNKPEYAETPDRFRFRFACRSFVV
jgi:hypothetical protein